MGLLFVNCVIENPSFDSQTKQLLKTTASKFGSKCVLSSKFIKDFLKTGITEEVIATADFKDERSLKKTDGKKKRRLIGMGKISTPYFSRPNYRRSKSAPPGFGGS